MDGRYGHGPGNGNPMVARMAGAQQGWPTGSSRHGYSMASVPGRHGTDRVPTRMTDSRIAASRMVPALMNSNHMPGMHGGDYSMPEHHAPMSDHGDDADMHDSYLSGSVHRSHGSRGELSCSEDERAKKHKLSKDKKNKKNKKHSHKKVGKIPDNKHKHRRQDHRGRKTSGKLQGSASKKRHLSGSTSSASYSSDSSEDQPDDDEMDFPLNAKKLGGTWLHPDEAGYAKLVYPEKSKLRVIRQSPGTVPAELLDSFNGGSMTAQMVDQLIFILSGCGPNTRLNRFMHVGTEKDRKRKHFKAKMLQQAAKLGQQSQPPVTTRLEILQKMAPPGPNC